MWVVEQAHACCRHKTSDDRALCLSQVLEVEPQPRWQLSDHQWGKVSASPYFARHPGAKLLPRRAICQTLQSSYKRG